jgi:hypothetical protein
MVARNDDNRGAPTGGEPSAAPAGLSWGRRQPVSQDVPAARRGQVKGLFGADPSSPVPAPAAASPDVAERRPESPPGAEPDPMDAFFGAEQSTEASTLLENADVVKTGARRAAARAWPLPGPSVAESEPPAPKPRSIAPLAVDPEAHGSPPVPGHDRDAARPRPSPPGRSGMRHKRVEPGGLPLPDESPAAAEPPRRVEAPVSSRSLRPADVAAAQLMAADREPPVHSPRWVLTGSILLAALVVGGAFMLWSLRGADSKPPPAAPEPPARSGTARSGTANDVVTWSPQSEHSHAPQVPAAPTTPAVPVAPQAPPAEAIAAPPSGPEPASAPPVNPAVAVQPPEVPAEPPAAPSESATGASPAADSAAVAKWWLLAARRKLASDDAEGAEAAARKALASQPQSLPATEVLVRALVDQDRGNDALPLARKLVQRAGKRVAFRLLLGDVLLMTGDEAGATREWERALELAPEDAEIKRRLGQ